MIIGGHVEKIKDLEIQLYVKFKMLNVRTMQQYIELEFIYLSIGIFLSQKKYANKLSQRFGMEINNLVSTLIDEGLQLQLNMGKKFVNRRMYLSMLINLIFLTHSRLDISFVVSCVSWYFWSTTTNSFHCYKKDFMIHQGNDMLWSILLSCKYERIDQLHKFKFIRKNYVFCNQ